MSKPPMQVVPGAEPHLSPRSSTSEHPVATPTSDTSHVEDRPLSDIPDVYHPPTTPLSQGSVSPVAADMKRTLQQEGESEDDKAHNRSHIEDTRILQSMLPPSPPLTRVGTNESVHEARPDTTLVERTDGAAEEMDVVAAEWHPLGHTRLNSAEKNANQTQEVTVVDDSDDPVGPDGRVLYPDEKASPTRLMPHLRIEPPSPQPWDLVDPPETDGDLYPNVGSKKFRISQSKDLSRPSIPQSSYYFGPPPVDAAYGTHPVGQIGLHHPREILRVERDYTGGEIIQFAPIYPLELDGRITPTQFLESMNAINEVLISAHSLLHSFLDNTLAVITLQVSRLFAKTHYEKEMQRLHRLFEYLNAELYNPAGLNLVWPSKVAFLFLEIEYY